ncbi:MAG: ATP-dependent DNA helicase RecG, partial [Thermoanaerobaculia bacterium]|nr:ATP-dependent DNA helicase RecG [Thermoanaerobaculia bacterium]
MTPNAGYRRDPDAPIETLRGVGAARARLLDLAGLRTIRDLLFHLPFRYEDRRRTKSIRDLSGNEGPLCLTGTIVSAKLKTSPVKRIRVFEALLDDGTGSIVLVWFNQPWIADKIRRGKTITVFGIPKTSSYGRLQLDSPEWWESEQDSDETGGVIPVYPTHGEITPRMMKALVRQALEALPAIDDPLDRSLRERLGIPERRRALLELHCPDDLADELALGRRTPAHERLMFDEFLGFQLALRIRREELERNEKPRRLEIDDEVRERVRAVLPFALTAAQKRVLKEIADDLRSTRPMYRLLQGDVGSGKTIVSLVAALLTISNGHQVAFLVPTEILARQHFERTLGILGDSVRIACLTGRSRDVERKTILENLRSGEIDLLIGTHAILEDPVVFESLGLAIVDEQQRFGVDQRRRLFEKGSQPDILVMTATPIPRSMAIALYGDLDVSILDEMPPGRKPVRTYVRGTSRLPKIFEFIESQLQEGSRAYVVYPLIDESEKLEAQALNEEIGRLAEAFPGRAIGTLHGRLSGEEKAETMKKFARGEIDILVATSIVEVGIDVPEATVMLINDAGRFGMSQEEPSAPSADADTSAAGGGLSLPWSRFLLSDWVTEQKARGVT